jgi:hypothetical protein
MGSHFGESAQADGAQGSIATRGRRHERELMVEGVLSDNELGEARELAQKATPSIVRELKRIAKSAKMDKDRIAASKMLLALAWGPSLFNTRSEPVAPPRAGVTVIVGGGSDRPAERVVIQDVGVAPQLEAELG